MELLIVNKIKPVENMIRFVMEYILHFSFKFSLPISTIQTCANFKNSIYSKLGILSPKRIISVLFHNILICGFGLTLRYTISSNLQSVPEWPGQNDITVFLG